MTSTIDFRTPGAGFDQPVEMWLACHERVQRFAALLSRLADHVRKQGADEDAQVTATSIRRYFNEAASERLTFFNSALTDAVLRSTRYAGNVPPVTG